MEHLLKTLTVGVDSVLGGKLFAAAYVIQGLLLTQCPEQQCRLYGWGDSPDSIFMMEQIGATILATGVVSSVMQFQEGITVHTAIGYLGAVSMISMVKLYLNDSFRRGGFKMENVFFDAITSVITTYAGFFSPDWADKALMTMTAFYTLAALHGIVMPGACGKLWCVEDFKGRDKKRYKYLIRHFMVFLLVMEVQNLLLLQSITEAHKAIGYACVIGLLFFLDGFFVSKSFFNILRPYPAYLFWVLFFGFLCPVTLLQE